VAVEDLDDHAGAVEHLGAGRPFQIADLAGRELVVDDHELGPAGASDRLGRGRQPRRALEPLPRLGFRRRRHRADQPVPPVSAASSASLPLPSSDPAPVPSRRCDTVPTTS
jgi:hypothetical protein